MVYKDIKYIIYLGFFISSLIPLIVIYFSVKYNHNPKILHLVFVINWILLISILQDLIVTIYFRKYTPGLLSTCILNIPFSAYLFYRTIHDKIANGKYLVKLLPLSTVIYFIVFVMLLWMSNLLKNLIH